MLCIGCFQFVKAWINQVACDAYLAGTRIESPSSTESGERAFANVQAIWRQLLEQGMVTSSSGRQKLRAMSSATFISDFPKVVKESSLFILAIEADCSALFAVLRDFGTGAVEISIWLSPCTSFFHKIQEPPEPPALSPIPSFLLYRVLPWTLPARGPHKAVHMRRSQEL